jgi:ParB family chromosome partitioning protein
MGTAPMQIEFHQLALRYEALRIADPARQARMTASLAEVGQQSPVLVVGAEPPFVLIDGYCRARALRALRRDTVEAVCLEVSEPEALLLAHRLDLSRPRSALEEGWFVQELHRTHALTLSELARRSGHSVSWISRRLALVESLPDVIQELVRRGKLTSHAAMKVLVPLARANATHALLVATRACELPERLSARQWEALYAAYRQAPSEIRSRIVEQPGLFVRVCEQQRRPEAPTPKCAAEDFVSDLQALSGLSRRARRRLRELSSAQLTEPSLLALVEPSWASARADFDALSRLVTERTRENRFRDEDGGASPSPAGPRPEDDRASARDLQEHGQAAPR